MTTETRLIESLLRMSADELALASLHEGLPLHPEILARILQVTQSGGSGALS